MLKKKMFEMVKNKTQGNDAHNQTGAEQHLFKQ